MSLPPEVDFVKDRRASPARMNEAMGYLMAQIRRALALQPDLEAALAEIQAVGLQRLAEGVTPLVQDASAANDQLQAILAAWTTAGELQAIENRLQASIDAQITALATSTTAAITALTTRVAVLEQAAALNAGIDWTNGDA